MILGVLVGFCVLAVCAVGFLLRRLWQVSAELAELVESCDETAEQLERLAAQDRLVCYIRVIVHRFWEDQHRHLLWETETGPEALKSAFRALGEIENLLAVFDQYGVEAIEPTVFVAIPPQLNDLLRQVGEQFLKHVEELSSDDDEDDPPADTEAPV